jgi:preprotein translocase subunit SecE
MADGANTTEKKTTSFFKGVKAEFKKIIWPDKNTLFKETVAVLSSTVVLGAVIALLDMGIQAVLNLIL